MLPIVFKVLAVFAARVVQDITSTLCVRRINQSKNQPASGLALFLILLDGYVTVNYVEHKWLIPVAAFGGYVGTWLAMAWDGKNHVPKA